MNSATNLRPDCSRTNTINTKETLPLRDKIPYEPLSVFKRRASLVLAYLLSPRNTGKVIG